MQRYSRYNLPLTTYLLLHYQKLKVKSTLQIGLFPFVPDVCPQWRKNGNSLWGRLRSFFKRTTFQFQKVINSVEFFNSSHLSPLMTRKFLKLSLLGTNDGDKQIVIQNPTNSARARVMLLFPSPHKRAARHAIAPSFSFNYLYGYVAWPVAWLRVYRVCNLMCIRLYRCLIPTTSCRLSFNMCNESK